MNQPLQRRAGGNIGVTSIGGGIAAYQQHVSAPVLTLENTDTVLWEPHDGCIRSPGGTKPKFPGLLLTNDLALPDIEVDLIFVDGTGKEFVIGDGFLGVGDGVGTLLIDGAGTGKLGLSPLGLCPNAGEKILARVTSAQLPNGKVKIVPYSKDFKVKGQGRGGLSDGGAVCRRGEVTSSGVDFGPRKGTSWEPLLFFGGITGGGGFLSMHLSNADAAELATVDICLVDPEGTERLIETVDVLQDSLVDVAIQSDFGGELRSYVQYPSKLRVMLNSSNAATKRVAALLMVTESDVAQDLAQEQS